MATEITVVARVTVEADPEQVWRLALDWSRQHEWIWATRVTGGRGRGAEVTAWTGIGPLGFTDTMVITEWDPPRRCSMRHTGRLVRGTAGFEVSPNGARSEFLWTEKLILPLPPAVGRPAGGLIRVVAGWGLNSSLRRFARLLARPDLRAPS